MSQGNWGGGGGPGGGSYGPPPGGGGYGPPPGGGGYGPPPGGGSYGPAPSGGGYGPAPGGRQETSFFTDNVVTITNARAILYGTTYALANITSVRSWTVAKPLHPLLLGILCLLTGFAMAVGGVGACAGVLVLTGVVATIWYFASKDHHYVRIGTAGGEVNALHSTSPAYIDQVVAALNNAIIHRG